MPHILNDAQHAAIGRVATQAARLEAVLEGFLVDALTHDTEVALVAVAGAQFERKTRMLEAILNLRIPTSEDLPAVKELLEEARVVMQERNAFLHGMWQFDADANLQVQNRERRSRKIKVRTVSVGDLNETAKRMTFLADEIEESWTDLLVDIGAYQALKPGLWQQISPHRPYATEEEKRRPGSFVIALSEADDESPDT